MLDLEHKEDLSTRCYKEDLHGGAIKVCETHQRMAIDNCLRKSNQLKFIFVAYVDK